jgi:hypothetical protein
MEPIVDDDRASQATTPGTNDTGGQIQVLKSMRAYQASYGMTWPARTG